jgi:O-antigen/teichoic acid export membrane protein
MSRARAAFLGSISSQVFMVVNMLLGIIITPILLKFLNKEEFGLSTVIFQLVGYINMLDFGLGNAMSRNLAANRGDDENSKITVNKIMSTTFFTFSVIGALVIIGGLSLSPFIPELFEMRGSLNQVAVAIIISLSISIGIQFPLRAFYGIFYAHQRQMLSNSVGFLMTFLNIILPVVFLYFNYGLWSFVYTNIICSLVGISTIMLLNRKYYPYIKIRPAFFDKTILSEMFHFGFFIFLNAIAYQVIFFTDRFFIGSLVSLSAVTIFSLTAKAPEFGRELIFKITDNAFPALVEINSKEGESKLKSVHQKLLLVTSCCFSIGFWMILILNVWFLKLWVGDGFFAGQAIFLLALGLMVIQTLIHVSGVCLIGAGLVKGFSLISLLEAAINISLTLWLGKMFGVAGVLLATVIAGSLTSLWYIPYTAMKFMKIRFTEYLKAIFGPLISISVVGMCLYWISRYLFGHIELNWVNFFAVALLLAIIFVTFTWSLFLRKELLHYIPYKIKRYLYLIK